MNVLLWVLQILTALLYGWSGVMKVFMIDEISGQVASFGALPREAWMALGVLELVCAVGLIVPLALNWHPRLTVSSRSRPSCSLEFTSSIARSRRRSSVPCWA
jgi:hypothetical protein